MAEARLHLYVSGCCFHFSFISLIEFFSDNPHSDSNIFQMCPSDGKEGKNKDTTVASSSSSSSSAKPKAKSSSSIAGIALCWQGVVQRQVNTSVFLVYCVSTQQFIVTSPNVFQLNISMTSPPSGEEVSGVKLQFGGLCGALP